MCRDFTARSRHHLCGRNPLQACDYKPYLFRSADGGRSWQSISDSFPATEITRVVRADPVRPGLLFVGTETGVYVSLDDGQG
jgi:hypothetical protein